MTAKPNKKDIEKRLQTINVLVVDGNQFMRKVARTLLTNAGVKNVREAADGLTALEDLRLAETDLLILDWDLPLMSGLELVKIVRSPGVFPVPDIPIIMLTGRAERGRVMAAAANGVNEFLVKPLSARTLRDRMVAIFACPRPTVQANGYYGPAPRTGIEAADWPHPVPGASPFASLAAEAAA